MNPVLLKPGSDRRSHVVLMGEPWGELECSRVPHRAGGVGEGGLRGVRRLGARVRRGDQRGCGQSDRDQPAPVRLREHGARAAHPGAGRGRRRHRSGRVVRVDVRHRRAASSGGPGAGQRVRREQVPRRRVAAAARDRHARLGDRPPDVRRAAVAARVSGSTPRTRWTFRPGVRRTTPTCCRSRWSGSRGSATSPTSTRWRWSRRRVCSSRRARPRSAMPIWSCCRGRGRRPPIWRGCGRTGWRMPSRRGSRPGGRCSGSVAGISCSAGRSRIRSGSRAAGVIPVSGCCRWQHLCGGEDVGATGADGVRDPSRGGARGR